MSTEPSGKSASLLYGLLYGAASIAFTVILYLGGVKTFMSPVARLGILVPIAFAVLTAWQQRKIQGGYLEFSEALKTIFKAMVTGLFMSMIFEYILFNYIDVPFNQALMQATSQEMERSLQGQMSQEKIDELVEKIGTVDQHSFKIQALTFAIRCILHFVLALIVAAIMKRKRPMFENSFNQ
jgi:hypothetical protein